MVLSKQKITNRLSIAVALTVFLGVALHDTKIDKFTAFAIAVPAVIAAYESTHILGALRGESHTHVERVSVDKTASRHTGFMPHLPTRRSQDDRYKQGTRSPEGRHPFDDVMLPVLT